MSQNQADTADGAPPAAPSFEDALAQLEAIVHELEDGQIGLTEALARYERGVGLLRECYGLLERAERRIELLTGVDVAGQPVTQAFDDESSAELEAKGQRRTRRRSGGKPSGQADLEPPLTGQPVDESRGAP